MPVLFALVASSCANVGAVPAAEPAPQTIERVLVAMGTSLQVAVTAPTRAQALQSSERAFEAVQQVEARLSTWREDSELAQLNRALVGSKMTLSGSLLRDMAAARRYSQATGGAFDPGIGALIELYRLRDGGRWPSDQEVWACLPHCGIEQLHVVRASASRRTQRLQLEEGGFGKGAGLDAAGRAALAGGAAAATFDFGGQVLRVGDQDGMDHYDIADPRDRQRAVVRVAMGNGSIATTANSERRLSASGREFGHILDPRTGRPAPDFGSVTVIAETAFAADCLSTALFVMGPTAALAWAEAQEGIEALVLEAPSDPSPATSLTVRMTSGLRHRVAALAKDANIQRHINQ